MAHPVSGPITPEELQRIAELPYGKAGAALRQHDPAWGMSDPDKPLRKYDVKLTGILHASVTVTVEASSTAQARLIAMQKRFDDLDWDNGGDVEDVEALYVEARK